ncbi:MAG: DUF21 domain-containing protein [Parachlamydiales bacterium]|nr:DUF21 domain-containing protein [Parachlamydiales bacterium]
MNGQWIHFLILSLTCVLVQGFFTMFEMASVSFNPIRLKYFSVKKNIPALQLQYLLDKPSRLFGTTLICMNVVLQIGSEASRRFYESLHCPAEFAPVMQIFLVLLFAELTPLFTARRHSQQIALAIVPIVYFLSKVLFPFVYLIDRFFSWVNRFSEKSPLTLSRDEILRAFEQSEEEISEDKVVENILFFKKKTAKDIMLDISEVSLLSSVEKTLLYQPINNPLFPYFLIYQHQPSHIIATGDCRDYLNMETPTQLMTKAKAPWFVLENTPLVQILEQFKKNSQRFCVVLDSLGNSRGIITLELLIRVLIGEQFLQEKNEKNILIDRVVDANLLLSVCNKDFHLSMPKYEKTIGEYVEQKLGHLPHLNEKIEEDGYEIIVEEVTLTGVKKVRIRSKK